MQVVPEGRPVPLFPLWFGIAGPPVAWAAQLLIAYSADELACSPGSSSHLVWGMSVNAVGIAAGVVAALVTVASGLLAARARKRLRECDSTPAVARSSFMTAFGVYSSIYFLIVILLTAVGPIGIPSCR